MQIPAQPNALADFIRKAAVSGPTPGKSLPNMGRSAFAPPSAKAPLQGSTPPATTSKPGQLSGVNGRPQAAPLPEVMLRPKPNPTEDRGSTERASPRQGLVQRDGNRVPKGDKPTGSQGPMVTASSPTAPQSGMERAFGQMADHFHPLGQPKNKRG